MSGDQSRVRAVFEGVKAAGRTVLTAPEARRSLRSLWAAGAERGPSTI